MRSYRRFGFQMPAFGRRHPLKQSTGHDDTMSFYCKQIEEAPNLEALLRFAPDRDQLNLHALSCEHCAVSVRPIWNSAVAHLLPAQQEDFRKLADAWQISKTSTLIEDTSSLKSLASTSNCSQKEAGILRLPPVGDKAWTVSWMRHLSLIELQQFHHTIPDLNLDNGDVVTLLRWIDDALRDLESKEIDDELFSEEPEPIGSTASYGKNKHVFQHLTYRPRSTVHHLENAHI